ncbi:hypothetical protein [Acidipila sp. EB88]|uniref:F0F1 ATP synthase subunit B family protein n=1 Tax=Acidipila sp. EB88 TaxID=2305226 RepID=UPI000F5FEE77|nr:hypothetical protein [Acidipila sp. EB88]RRA48572.1 hypothetical protein D1Y84_10020 [Acidipila sp. EB88]
MRCFARNTKNSPTRLRGFAAPSLLALALLCPLVPAITAHAQATAQTAPQPTSHLQHDPQTTGGPATKMEGGVPEEGLEQYTHSSTVAAIAKHLGVSTAQAARYFEDFNSGVLILVILYFLVKLLPGKFRAKRQGITKDLESARQQTADAQERLGRIERQLQSIGTEVDALRQQAAASSHRDEIAMQQALETERQRIVRAAQAEIQAAQATAERGLKRYASDLAVDRAAERVQLTTEGDKALVDEFLQGLAGELGKRGQN